MTSATASAETPAQGLPRRVTPHPRARLCGRPSRSRRFRRISGHDRHDPVALHIGPDLAPAARRRGCSSRSLDGFAGEDVTMRTGLGSCPSPIRRGSRLQSLQLPRRTQAASQALGPALTTRCTDRPCNGGRPAARYHHAAARTRQRPDRVPGNCLSGNCLSGNLGTARHLGSLQGSSSRDRRGPLVPDVVRRHPGSVRYSVAAAGRIGLGDRRRLFTGVRDGRTDQAQVPGAIEPSLVAPRSAVRSGNTAACRNESVGRRVEQAEPARCRSGWSACRSRVHRFTLMSRQASGMCSLWCWGGLPPSGQHGLVAATLLCAWQIGGAAARSPEHPAPQAWSPPWPSYCDVTSSAASSGAESTAIGAALD